MDLLELLKTIGAAAGNIVTISGCLALCIRPIREKLARFIRRASRTDASEKRIADMFAMLEQHIEADQAKIVSSELLKKAVALHLKSEKIAFEIRKNQSV